MKTAISIPDPLFARADKLAREFHISRSELYARAIERFVATYDEAATRSALAEVYGTEDSSLPEPLMAAQAEVLSEWEEG